MTALFDTVETFIDFLFFHPKSTVTSILLLIIVLLIAFYVNRKRDAAGRVSFVDRSRQGVIGVRLFEMADGERGNSWLLPLWAGERRVLLNVKVFLPKGEYEIKGVWMPDDQLPDEGEIFEQRPADGRSVHSLTEVGRFTVSRSRGVEFRMTASAKRLQIDSPDKEFLEADEEKRPLPLVLTDSSLKWFALRFEKLKKKEIWELSLVDHRIIAGLHTKIKNVTRKLDGAEVKRKDLEAHLDKAVRQIGELRKGE